MPWGTCGGFRVTCTRDTGGPVNVKSHHGGDLKDLRELGRQPRLNEGGEVLPSNEKNSNDFPSHRIPKTGTLKPFIASHAMDSKE